MNGEQNDNAPSAYNRICSECMDQTLKTYIASVAVIMLSFAGSLIGPLFAYLQDGSLVTLYEVRIPFLEEHPRTEFIMNITWQNLFSVIVGIPGLFIVEGIIALITNAIIVSSKLTVNEFEDLSDELESCKITRDRCGCRLVNIFRQIIYMDE